MKGLSALGLFALIGFNSPPVRAEQGEITLGVEGGVLLPSFEALDQSAFALATWFVGAAASYGVLDDLSAELSLALSSFDAELSGHERMHLGRTLSGDLFFSSTHVELLAIARYNLFAGYPVTPYLEAGVGGLFSSYRGQRLLSPAGLDYGLSIDDESELGLVTTLGAAVEFRIVELLLLRLSLRGAKNFGNVRWDHTVRCALDVLVSL